MKSKKLIITSSVVLCLLLALVLTTSIVWNSYSIPTEEDKQITVHDNQMMRLSATSQSINDYTVTATVLPETASDKNLEWYLAIDDVTTLDAKLMVREFVSWVQEASENCPGSEYFLLGSEVIYEYDLEPFLMALELDEDYFTHCWLPVFRYMQENFFPNDTDMKNFCDTLDTSNTDCILNFLVEFKCLYLGLLITDISWSSETEKKYEMANCYFSSLGVLEEYINIDVSPDTLACAVNYLKPFNFPIRLYAQSQFDESISAYCTFGCYERCSSIFVSTSIGNTVIGSTKTKSIDYNSELNNYSDTMSVDFSDFKYEDFIDEEFIVGVDFTTSPYYVGTHEYEDDSFSIYIEPTAEIIDTGLGLTNFIALSEFQGKSLNQIMMMLYGYSISERKDDYSISGHWFDIVIRYRTTEPGTGDVICENTLTIECIGFTSISELDVTSVVLSHSSLVF